MYLPYTRMIIVAMMSISDHFVTGEKADTAMRQEGFTNMMQLALETAIF